MEEFKNHPYIESAEIHYGGLFGPSEKRYFKGERLFDGIPGKIIVQQFHMKHLSKRGVREMIVSLESRAAELKEQLKGL